MFKFRTSCFNIFFILVSVIHSTGTFAQPDQIGVVAHIIRFSDGTFQGYPAITVNEVNTAIGVANNAFATINPPMEFFLVAVRYIDSDSWATNITTSNLSFLFDEYNLYASTKNNEKAINLYFAPDLVNAKGKASLPPGRAALVNAPIITPPGIVIQNEFLDSSVVPHEFGHF